jgi:regulator of replication initiation timing
MLENEEAVAAEEAYEEAVAAEERVTDSINTLEHIKNMIEKHGISRPMMEMADPIGELAEAGIVPAYENLEDTPVHDSNATAAIEGLGETMRKAWDKIVAFMKDLWKRLKGLFDKVVGVFKKQDVVIKALLKKMKDVDIDGDKADKVKVKILKGTDFSDVTKVVSALITIIGTVENRVTNNTNVKDGKEPVFDRADFFDSINEDKILKVESDDHKKDFDGTEKTYYTFAFKNELETDTETVKKVGPSTINDNLKAALTILADAMKLGSVVKDLEKSVKDADKIARVKTDDKDELKKLDSKLKAYKEGISVCNKLVSIGMSVAKTAASTAIAQGRGALAASK